MLSGIITITCGVVLGTLLTWIISYYMSKRILPKLLKSLSSNPEIIKAILALKMKSDCEQTRMKTTDERKEQ
jgi:membrane protein YqaA with SNARE-associated domain